MTTKQFEDYQKKVNRLLTNLGGKARIRVELDNLDELISIRFDEKKTIVVENEHCSEFGLDELSKSEFDVLIFELEGLTYGD